MADVKPDTIFQISCGFMASKFLFVANEVGLFKHLADSPASLDELTQRIGLPSRTMRILTDAMVALGFVENHSGQYQNSATALSFLSGHGNEDLRPLLRYLDLLNYSMWMKLEDAVRTGEPVFKDLKLTEEEQRIYSEGVESFTTEAANALPDTYDFTSHHRLLDLGGGTGSFLTAVLRKASHLKAVLFERPQVAAVARQRIPQAISNRITIVEGDFFTDPIPQDNDVIIIANVMHLLSPEHNLLVLLRRVRQELRNHATLLLVDFWTNSTHTEPLFAALMAGAFLLRTGEGDIYSEEEVLNWLQETGWRTVDRRPLGNRASVIVAGTGN
jgi:SAM-dependent methyltransferase